MLCWAFCERSRRALARESSRFFDQPAFGIESLPLIPAKVSGVTVMSIDLVKSFDLIEALLRHADLPEAVGPSSLGRSSKTVSTSARTCSLTSARSWRFIRSRILTMNQPAPGDSRRREQPVRRSQYSVASKIE